MAKAKVFKLSNTIIIVLCLIIGFVGGFSYQIYSTVPKSDIYVSGDLQFHFLELGNKYTGDATYIKVGDVDILIDAGSKQNSAQVINAYLDNYVTDGKLEYVIATHAHEDHISGFYSTTSQEGVFAHFATDIIIDFPNTNHTNPTASSVVGKYNASRDAEVGNGATHYTALQCYNEEAGAKRVYEITSSVQMEILYNYYYDHNDSSGENNYSVCVIFHQGERHFLFTGDLEEKAENKLVDYYASNHGGLPHCDLYKAGHHGSKTSSGNKLLDAVDPDIVCVCCCCGTSEYTDTDENQFPTQEFVDRIASHTDKVYVTTIVDNYVASNNWSSSGTVKSMNGNIVVTSSRKGISVECSNNNTLFKDTLWFSQHRVLPVAWQTSG